ncbi:MAG: DegT/DnrJ/EryC1/StrS family aminotransferase [Labilithrix sp.]|nr:DegT/DnrJ/EryC1/StrS family aminotransferase [Labilithrix sp.]MCW5816691.1 DegT/DnrJ/EryC1/StrS family aminotransferase [Labilithrix sp.]
MPVPFIDLKRLVSRVREDVLPAFAECIDKCELVGGPRIPLLEKKLASALGVPRAATCANGTDALVIGLQALGVKRGMKIALPNLTFWATFEAIVQLGAVPVLVDVDAEDLQLDLEQLKSAHEKHRIDGVILVHLFGWTSARLAEIRAFCKERELILLEDGAQCFGVEVGGEPVLAKANLATLSFYPAKVVGGAMDGGAMTMQTEKLEQHVKSLCNHGRSDHYAYAHVGWNSRMGGMQAAFILRMLDEVPGILETRRAAAAYYREQLGGDRRIKVYGPPAGVTENGYLNVVTVEGKSGAELSDALKQKGIGTARTYPEPMHVQPPIKASGAILHGDLAVSTRFCESVINLPLFAFIRDDEREESAAALLSVI